MVPDKTLSGLRSYGWAGSAGKAKNRKVIKEANRRRRRAAEKALVRREVAAAV